MDPDQLASLEISDFDYMHQTKNQNIFRTKIFAGLELILCLPMSPAVLITVLRPGPKLFDKLMVFL